MTTLNVADVRWRVSNTWDKNGTKWGMLVGYIDSRTAMDALDALDPNWSSRMEPIAVNGESGVRCTLTVNGVSREDVGVPSNTEPLKGAFSDALKRAAVHFGIGRELYELPKIGVECEVVNGKVRGPKAKPEYVDGRWTIDSKVGWVRYEREPDEQPGQGAQSEPIETTAATVAASALASATNVLAETRYAWALRHGWDAEALDATAVAAIGKPVRDMDSLDWQLFASTIKDGPNATPASPGEQAAPEAGVVPPDPAPALPPKPQTDEYKALDVKGKAQARSYWATKSLEERQPEPVNPEQTVLPVEVTE